MAKLKNKDIAEALGLSTAAVSMALNDKPGVSNETRKRVLEYYQSHSSPHQHPAALSASRRTLVMIIHKTTGEIIIDKPFFSSLTSSIEIEARKNGYLLIMSTYDAGFMDLDGYIDSLNLQRPAGVLILATELTEAALLRYQKKLEAPYVLLDGYIESIPCSSVTLDNSNAMFRAYKYAFEMGHRRIGYLKGNTDIPNFIHRFDGYCKGIRTFQPDADGRAIVFSFPCNVEGAKKEAEMLLDRLPKNFQLPTCFLSDLDFIAIGFMTALKERGYRIPDDVSIIGFDNIEFSAVTEPPLTTIRLHQQFFGKYAIQLLIDGIENNVPCHINVRPSSELVIRDSVKKLDAPPKAPAE